MTRQTTLLATAAMALALPAFAADPELVVFDWAGFENQALIEGYVAKHGAMPTYAFFGDDDEAFQKVASGFKALRDDGISALLLKPLGFRDGGGGRPNLKTPCLELLHPLGLGQTKVKADHSRFELAHEREAFFAERRAAWTRAHRCRVYAM